MAVVSSRLSYILFSDSLQQRDGVVLQVPRPSTPGTRSISKSCDSGPQTVQSRPQCEPRALSQANIGRAWCVCLPAEDSHS